MASASTIDIRRAFSGSFGPPSESYSTTSQAQRDRWRGREALPYARLTIRDERRPVDNIEEDKKRIKPYEGMMSQLMPAPVDFRRYPETRLMSSEFDWQRLRKLVEAFGGYEDGKTILQVTLHLEDRVMGAGRLSHEGEFHQAIAKMIDIAGWDDQNTAHAPEIAVAWVLRDGNGERDPYDPFQQVLDPPPGDVGERAAQETPGGQSLPIEVRDDSPSPEPRSGCGSEVEETVGDGVISLDSDNESEDTSEPANKATASRQRLDALAGLGGDAVL